MQLHGYDELVAFASAGTMVPELQQAKAEYSTRTGELFETDPSFEHRMSCFLEWYTLDRKVTIARNATPARLYIEHVSPELTTQEINDLRTLTRTTLSLFELKKIRGGSIKAIELLTGTKYDIAMSTELPGIEPGDIVVARLFSTDDNHFVSDNMRLMPRKTRRQIIKAAKALRKKRFDEQERLNFVHNTVFLLNKSDRYKHLDPEEVFREISK